MGRALHAYNMCAEIIIKLNFSWLMGPGEIVGSFIFLGTKFVRVKGPRSNRLFPCRRCRLVKSWYNLELLNLPICLKALRHGEHNIIRTIDAQVLTCIESEASRLHQYTAANFSGRLKVAQSNVLCTVLGLLWSA